MIKKIVLTAVLSLAVCLGGASFAALPDAVPVSSAAENNLSILDKTYYVNQTLSIPGYTFSDGNTAVKYVMYPDGSVYRQNSVTFDKTGSYSIIYRNPESEEKITKSVDVKYRHYYFTGSSNNKSKAYYGKDSSGYNTGITGLTVELYSGDTFYYDDIIDIRKCQDNLHHEFMNFFAVPHTLAHFDVERFHIRLTDIYNEGRYLDIYIFPYPQRLEPEEVPDTADENWKYFDTFINVGGENQIPIGLDWKADGTATINKQNLSGFSAAHSMYGYSFRKNSVGQEILDLGLNLETLEFESTHRIGSRKSIVCDLDDYSYEDSAWEGFTTGEVRMSIEAYLYRDANIPFRFMITDLAGNDLSAGEDTDVTGPEITLKNDLRPLYVNHAYTIPEINVTDDLSYVTGSRVSVYYNYNSDTQYEIDVKDGAFTPAKEGIYTLVYECSDSFNNKTVKKVRINASQGSPENISLDFSASSFSYATGQEEYLPEYTVAGDILKTECIMEFDGKKEEVSSEEKYSFKSKGTYTCTVTAYDYYGNSLSKSVNITVSDNSKPFFAAAPALPKYIVEGGKYKLPSYRANDYTSLDGYTDTNCMVDYGDGYKMSDGYIDASMLTSGSSAVNVRYTAANSFGSVKCSYEIPYVRSTNDNGRYQLTNLFYGSNIVKTAGEEEIKISSVKADQPVKYEYANMLNANNFNLTFGFDAAKSSFTGLKLTLTDAYDSSNYIELVFNKNGSKSTCTVNDRQTYDCSLGLTNSETMVLNYNNVNRSVISSDFKFQIRKDKQGKEFTGFKSSMLYLSFEYLGMTGPSGIIINKLCGHYMSNSETDLTKPTVIVSGDYDKEYELGDTVTIYSAFGLDVVDPSPQMSLTVLALDGDTVKDVNGTVMENVSADKDYEIKLEYGGTYNVRYTATDASKRSYQYTPTFSVVDNKAPVINSVNKTVRISKGQSVIIDVTAVDNTDDSPVLIKEVVNPDGTVTVIENSARALRMDKEGEYYIRFTAYDESGNISSVTYKVYVI